MKTETTMLEAHDFQETSNVKVDVAQTFCCGVKDYHGIYNYRSEKQLVPHMLALVFDAPTTSEIKDMQDHGGTRRTYEIKSVITPPAHIVFNGLKELGDGGEMDDCIGLRAMGFITKHKLGAVIKTASALNRNSRNHVVTFVWTPDWPACADFWEKNGFRRKTHKYGNYDYPPATEEIKATFKNTRIKWEI